MKQYTRHSEAELKAMANTLSIEVAVSDFMNKTGFDLVSVDWVGGCRASGQHVYHFVRKLEYEPV